jgi:hypothetical protein
MAGVWKIPGTDAMSLSCFLDVAIACCSRAVESWRETRTVYVCRLFMSAGSAPLGPVNFVFILHRNPSTLLNSTLSILRFSGPCVDRFNLCISYCISYLFFDTNFILRSQIQTCSSPSPGRISPLLPWSSATLLRLTLRGESVAMLGET